jgi:hypothetical protein
MIASSTKCGALFASRDEQLQFKRRINYGMGSIYFAGAITRITVPTRRIDARSARPAVTGLSLT